MDPLDLKTDEELLFFFHRKKTEISSIEQPHRLLTQLRDHDLVPEKLFENVKKMRSRKRKEKSFYEVLNWLEKDRPQDIKQFWQCVFEDHILKQYPTLRTLRNTLLGNPLLFYEKHLEVKTLKDEKESEGKAEEKKGKNCKIKMSKNDSSEDNDDPDSYSPSKKKPRKKPLFGTNQLYEKPSDVETPTEEKDSKGKAEERKEESNKRKRKSPVKKGDKQETWMCPYDEAELSVTCGDKEGILYRDKLTGGEECILSQECWFTPSEFEKFGGMAKSKNWKFSIRCNNIPLKKLIEDGYLQCPQRKRRKITGVQKNMNERIPNSSNKRSSKDSKANSSLVEESDPEHFQEQGGKGGETEIRGRVEEEEEEEENMADLSVFQAPSLPVTCVSLTGSLYKSRFASGSRGKCIRTEEGWFTPEEFVKQELNLTDGHWKKDILCHGKTLNVLHKKEILQIHSLLCECEKCSTREEDVMAQNNDDECYVCRSAGDLVCCDECPRAFHSHCHLPEYEDSPGEWICTFCQLKNHQQWCDSSNMSEQEAFSAPVSQYLLHCHYLLLCVYREDIQKVFVKDPRKTKPRFSEIITRPMWLDRIKQKLESGTYQRVGAFVSDIQLIFSNCSAFNRDNDFVRMGARLKEMFEEEFQKIFSIKKKVLVEESDPEDFQEQGGRRGGTKFRGRVEEEDEEEEDMADLSVFQAPSLPVTCVSLTGTLYKYRFASGSRGKCIRTEERWFTPEEFVKQELTLTDGHWRKDILCHGKTLNFLLGKKILCIHVPPCECVKCSTQEDVIAQNNDDECFVCHSGGDLVCCDECPRAFHSRCHLPAVHGDSPGEWICTFCVLRSNQQWRDPSKMSEQEAFTAPVFQCILHCHYLLLRVYREDTQKVFVKDPRKTVPRYSEFITRPMWLDRIKQKLESGVYQTVGAFFSDIQLIFSNCRTFNRDNVFGQMGARLKKMFEEEFQKIFNINKTEVFTPIILKGNDKDKDKNSYRFVCPCAGQFRCSLTRLVFVMEGKGEVQYNTVSWDPRLLDGLGEMEPAGPLYDIDCFDGSISGLHLPHCEIYSEEDMDCLAVAHFTGGNIEKINPLKVTKAHVMIDIKGLSIFGLIKRMIFPPSPVNAQVLVFLRPIAERQRENILDVHLLPWNVPLSEVKGQHAESMHIKTSSKCHLTPGTGYRLCCQADICTVQPETEVFEFNFGPNYHPTFEVFVNVENNEVKLSLMDNTEGREVWRPRRILLTATSDQEVELPAQRKLTESEKFVKKHRHHLIERVTTVMAIADCLRAKDMITREMYSKVLAKETPQDKMRLVLNACDSGGASVKEKFYRLLKKYEQHLVNDLESEPSRPQ